MRGCSALMTYSKFLQISSTFDEFKIVVTANDENVSVFQKTTGQSSEMIGSPAALAIIRRAAKSNRKASKFT